MSYNSEEAEILSSTTNEVGSPRADFWLDDVLTNLRANDDLNQMLKLAADGPNNIQRVIKRKLYEEFGIKVSRIIPALRNRRVNDIPKLPARAQSRRSQTLPQAPKLLNQKCDRVSNGNKLHKVLGDWKMPKKLVKDQKSEPQNETGLIRPRSAWQESDLLSSLSSTFKNDSYYLVSLHPLQFIVPPNLNNTNSGPKMTLGRIFTYTSDKLI